MLRNSTCFNHFNQAQIILKLLATGKLHPLNILRREQHDIQQYFAS